MTLAESTSATSTTTENNQSSVQLNDNVTDGIGNLSDVSSDNDNGKSTSANGLAVSPSTFKMRRQFLGKELGEYKQEKLKRKLPIDAQMLDCAHKDIQIKRRLVEQIDKMDKQYVESVASISMNMEKLTDSISEGFSLLRSMLYMTPPPSVYGGPVASSPFTSYNSMYAASSDPRFFHTRPPDPLQSKNPLLKFQHSRR